MNILRDKITEDFERYKDIRLFSLNIVIH